MVSAFTEGQVERLTGVTKRQLRYWDRTGFFVPSLAFEDRSQPFSRLYSFRDLVSLKVLNALRNDGNVPLPRLREVKERLAHLGDELWSKTTLFVLNKRVIFVNPETGEREDVLSKQGVLQIPLQVVTGNMEEAVRSLGHRDASAIGKFERQRNVAYNRLVVSGTRIPVDSIKAFADAGYSVEEIIKEYPALTRDDVLAAIDHEAA
jgi:uncharacterized protein (DUF433 family)